jgi:hypothetical protein
MIETIHFNNQDQGVYYPRASGEFVKAFFNLVLAFSALTLGALSTWPIALPTFARSVIYTVSHKEDGRAYTVSENIMVSGDRPKTPHVEPYVAANPKDAKHLVASIIAYTRSNGRSTCAVFTSFDGGKTWTRGTLPGLDKLDMFFAADPWVTFGPSGTVFSSCLVDNFRSTPERVRQITFIFSVQTMVDVAGQSHRLCHVAKAASPLTARQSLLMFQRASLRVQFMCIRAVQNTTRMAG